MAHSGAPKPRDAPSGATLPARWTVRECLASAGPVHVLMQGRSPLGAGNPTVRHSLPYSDHYDERALLLAGEADIACLATPPDAAYLDYLVGLGFHVDPDRIVVASGNRTDGRGLGDALARDGRALARIAELVAGAPNVVLTPFAARGPEQRLARSLEEVLGVPVRLLGGSVELALRVREKHHVRAAAAALGLPLADGSLVQVHEEASRVELRPLLDAALRRAAAAYGRVIVRGTRGTSASSVRVVEPGDAAIGDALRWAVEDDPNHIFLVERCLPTTVSPNLQFFLPPDAEPVLVGITDQMLSGGIAHSGNLYPSAALRGDAMAAEAARLARWLAAQGFLGFAGFDFVEYRDDDGRPAHVFAEMNARANASLYPLAVAERLNARRSEEGLPELLAFAAGKIRFPGASFSELLRRAPSAFFDHSTGRGGFIYLPRALPLGVVPAVAFGATQEEATEELRRFEAALARSGPGRQ